VTKEQVLSSEPIYKGRVVNLRVDTVTWDGKHTFKREIIEHNGAVAMVPLDAKGNITLVRQYRSGAARDLLELPAGGLDDDELRDVCARRELQEEIGMYPEELIELGSFYVAASYTTERITIYLARHLRPSVQPGDADEAITTVQMPFKSALEMALTNQIEDSKTIIGLMWAARHLGVLIA
jgi:ADP-ribose pyrophosphatase